MCGTRWDPSQVPKELADIIRGPLSIIFPWGLERSQTTGSWQMLSQFSRRERRKTLVVTGLSVSLWCLMEKVLLGVLEKDLRDNSVIVTAVRAHDGVGPA